jgi:hypothetical protein
MTTPTEAPPLPKPAPPRRPPRPPKEAPPDNEPEQLIELIAAQTRLLLQNHWPDIRDFVDGGEIKINFNHALSYEGNRRTVKTVIRFGRRVTDEIEDSIDTAQIELPIEAREGKRK